MGGLELPKGFRKGMAHSQFAVGSSFYLASVKTFRGRILFVLWVFLKIPVVSFIISSHS